MDPNQLNFSRSDLLQQLRARYTRHWAITQPQMRPTLEACYISFLGVLGYTLTSDIDYVLGIHINRDEPQPPAPPPLKPAKNWFEMASENAYHTGAKAEAAAANAADPGVVQGTRKARD